MFGNECEGKNPIIILFQILKYLFKAPTISCLDGDVRSKKLMVVHLLHIIYTPTAYDKIPSSIA